MVNLFKKIALIFVGFSLLQGAEFQAFDKEKFEQICNNIDDSSDKFAKIKACSLLGDAYLYGENGVKKDLSKAKIYYEKTCDIPAIYSGYTGFCGGRGYYGNDMTPCYLAGFLYEREGNLAKALKYLEQSCEKDGVDICVNSSEELISQEHYKAYDNSCEILARIYSDDRYFGVKRDIYKARYYRSVGYHFDENAEKTISFGFSDDDGGKREMQDFQNACEAKNRHACAVLGGHFGFTKKEKAKSYYKKACDLGLKTACVVLKNVEILNSQISFKFFA